MVGVVPNTAYRHFADRDALLAAVRDEAVRELAQRMAGRMSASWIGPGLGWRTLSRCSFSGM